MVWMLEAPAGAQAGTWGGEDHAADAEHTMLAMAASAGECSRAAAAAAGEDGASSTEEVGVDDVAVGRGNCPCRR